ncbi:MAG: PAS domain S-box protein, partial [Bacteroidetes bacterium]|nr:PAS domain S-box protein [Bacteroidota bacterium]
MMKYAAIREKLLRLIFGNTIDLNLERKVQIILTFLTFVLLSVGLIYCIVAEMSVWLLVLIGIAEVVIIIFYLIARNSANYRSSILPLFIISIFFLCAAWLLNGGYDGNIMTLMFAYFLLLYVIIQHQYRPIVFVTFLIMITLLICIQYMYPQYVHGYANEEQRFGDMIISNLMYLILFYSFIDLIIAHYVAENGKISRINEEIAENIARVKKSESKYHELSSLQRLMSDTMPDLIWAKDVEKRFIFVNKAMCTKLLHAVDTNEPIGKTDLFFAGRQRLLHPNEPNWHTFGELCQDSDEVTMREMREMQFDEFGNVEGKFLFLDVRKAPLFDNTGKLIGIVGTARDVTAQKRIEETLQLSYHSLESISEFITITDLDDKFTYVNQAFLNAYGYSREEIIGKTPAVIWSTSNNAGLINEILAQSRTGGWRGEVLNTTRSGREFLVSLSTSQVKDKNGKIIALAGISKDITAQKHAEDQLQVSEERQRFILESLPVAIYSASVDPDVDTSWISGDVLKITGYTVEEYLSDPGFWRQRLHPNDVAT